jgi:site-specific DNA recombinase
VQGQLDFLRKYCDLHQIAVAGEYVDDGISGIIPIGDRPDGRRLLDDAEADAFNVVLSYRLDRLGRSLSTLLDAHGRLERLRVAIKSATEPFDTTTPIGTFLFQLLGSLAELERSTIAERTSMGRNRVARNGQYTGGPIPLGYDLDDERRLIPSARPVPALGGTEAEMVCGIFARLAAGESTLNAECQRLTALGVPRRKRYGGPNGRSIEGGGRWGLSSLVSIVHNPVYKGEGVVKSVHGPVTRPAPALVDPGTWQRVQEALLRNRRLSKKNAKRQYLLRGLIRCAGCGQAYVGIDQEGVRKYRCASGSGRADGKRPSRCPGKTLDAAWLEGQVWAEVRRFVENPGEAMEDAKRQLRARMAEAGGAEAARKRLLAQLAGKDAERERVLGLFRRGRITSAEAERELDAIAGEAAELREMAEALRTQVALADAHEAYLANAAAMLSRAQGRLAEIEATGDLAAMREQVELLVPRIIVETEIVGADRRGRRKQATVRLTLAFRDEPASVSGMSGFTVIRGGRAWSACTESGSSRR